MRFIRNCTAAVAGAAFGAAALIAQSVPSTTSTQAPSTSTGQAEFLVFIGGKPVGREQVNVGRSGGNWIITATGSLSAPAQIDIKRFEAKYAADWQPLELHIEATLGGKPIALST